ncbi:unnamed protein product, partial [Scytosiphon promiscuus]
TTPHHTRAPGQDVSCSVGKKQLLQGVTGKARAGKLLAVMGPSGS